MRRDTLVDLAMKGKWAVLSGRVLGDYVQAWRALKELTSGLARTIVQRVRGENGRRKLHIQFEPKLVVRQTSLS